MGKGDTGNKEIRISGIINSLDWDKDDNVISIGISTEEEDYVIALNRMGKELFDYVGEEVEVTGMVLKGKAGLDRIEIVAYELVDYDDDDDDDDYDDDDYEEDDEEDYDGDMDDDDFDYDDEEER